MADLTPETQPFQSERWLISPDLPPGLRFQLEGVIEATEFNPEVLQLLGRAMTELQQSPTMAAQRVTCPALRRCTNYVGGCPRLTHCGNYSLSVSDAGATPDVADG
jgi:hypothetical protein